MKPLIRGMREIRERFENLMTGIIP